MTGKRSKMSIGSIANLYPQIPHPSPPAIQTQLTWMAEKDPRAKAAKPEQFIDGSILREIEKSGFVTRLYQQK